MNYVVERTIAAALPRFEQRGIRNVSWGEIRIAAGISHAEFHANFSSVDDIAALCLERHGRDWSADAAVAEARTRSAVPADQLLAIFDVVDEWFAATDDEGSTFVNVLLEMGSQHPLGEACVGYLVDVRQSVEALATEAGLRDIEDFSHSWSILMRGAIVCAAEGDALAIRRAKKMAHDLITRFTPAYDAFEYEFSATSASGALHLAVGAYDVNFDL